MGKTCLCGCGREITPNYRGKLADFVRGHYAPERRKRAETKTHLCNGYRMVYAPEHPRAPSSGYMAEHIMIAERALGKPLPDGAEVHHANEVRADNTPGNLVICPDAAYHQLLHQRARALDACGHADWRKCHVCKQWDAPDNLYTHPKAVMHRACHAAYQRQRKDRHV